MRKRRSACVRWLASTVAVLIACLGVTHAAYAQEILYRYAWHDKLLRGMFDVIAAPVETARTVYIVDKYDGTKKGMLAGAGKGLFRGVMRVGAGVIEMATFPISYPVRDKGPLMYPEFPWENWDDVIV